MTNLSTALAPDADPCAALARISERVGADPLLIQAAGGNTSVKDGDTLWVKASGLWLRDALKRPLFAPVSLSAVRARVQAGEADPVGPALRTDLAPAGLRPSIETTLHALMPHAVVLHVHAVDAIAWAMLPDAVDELRMPLAGHRWAWVPYAMPGIALTRAVAQVMSPSAAQDAAQGGAPVDVLMMANHGLVVGGATADEAGQRLDAVIARLRRPQRAAPSADEAALAALCADTGYRLPALRRVHAIATDPVNLRRARHGVPYPDHVVFLGAGVACLPEGRHAADWLRVCAAAANPPPYVALPGLGVLVRDGLDEGAQEMLGALADVLVRLPESPEPVFLPPHEVAALRDWEAEKYRRTLTR